MASLMPSWSLRGADFLESQVSCQVGIFGFLPQKRDFSRLA